ncbi:MAG: transcriptional regulator [Zoogloeaceae bacterium]|uniref:P-II family nitrogen regulator n=1 Tax=Denitromonas sp. TaxID=2734609 RepID=UPI002CC421EF|nr:transcriptional regulator [Zoogloeaceae bacterium]HQU90239.1 transcriptional regulator [Denitromonas sp.]
MSLANDHTRKLLTLVTEAAIESSLVRDLDRLGAHGYTITEARGKGNRGVRNAGWDASSNIRIEVVCNDETAAAIAAHLKAQYYDNYAMIMWVSEVEVLRPEKF